MLSMRLGRIHEPSMQWPPQDFRTMVKAGQADGAFEGLPAAINKIVANSMGDK